MSKLKLIWAYYLKVKILKRVFHNHTKLAMLSCAWMVINTIRSSRNIVLDIIAFIQLKCNLQNGNVMNENGKKAREKKIDTRIQVLINYVH